MRKLIEIIHMVRGLDLKKPPSIAESIDWARALMLLGAADIDKSVFDRTMSIIVKHRTDLDVVAERVECASKWPPRTGRAKLVLLRGAGRSTAACPRWALRGSHRS